MLYFTSTFFGLLSLFRTAISAPHQRSTLAQYDVPGRSVDLTFHNAPANPLAQFHEIVQARSVTAASRSNGSTSLKDLDNAYAATVSIGTQSFDLLIDTGSSDTWVADSFFNCLSTESYGYYPLKQASCGLQPTFVRSSSDSSVVFVEDKHFSVNYADGSSASGPIADAFVSLSDGLSFSSYVGIATNVAWRLGKNNTSGILGLGYSGLTSMFPGTDPYLDVSCPFNSSTVVFDYSGDASECNQLYYSSFYNSLASAYTYSSNGTATSILKSDQRFFTLVLSRDSSNTSAGGLITFGGQPKFFSPVVNITGNTATAVPSE